MNIPGFSAEASLYRTSNHYRSGYGLMRIALQNDRAVVQAFQSVGMPSAVVIGSDTNCGNDNSAARMPNSSGIPKIGDPAPEINLPDLGGKQVDLTDFRGSEMVLLFWNPNCGFCNRMADDLKTWEANLPKDAPKLLLVSTGTVEANKAMGLHSPIILEQGFTTGTKFGVKGTPSAIRIDAEGRIASQLVVGAPSIMTLIGT